MNKFPCYIKAFCIFAWAFTILLDFLQVKFPVCLNLPFLTLYVKNFGFACAIYMLESCSLCFQELEFLSLRSRDMLMCLGSVL